MLSSRAVQSSADGCVLAAMLMPLVERKVQGLVRKGGNNRVGPEHLPASCLRTPHGLLRCTGVVVRRRSNSVRPEGNLNSRLLLMVLGVIGRGKVTHQVVSRAEG
jgi:hypothetical protein